MRKSKTKRVNMTLLETIQAPFKALANTGIFLSLTLYHSGKDLSKLIANALETAGPYLIAAIVAAHIVMLPIALIIDCIFAAPALVSGATTAYNAKDSYYPLESNPKQNTSSPSKSQLNIEKGPSGHRKLPSTAVKPRVSSVTKGHKSKSKHNIGTSPPRP